MAGSKRVFGPNIWMALLTLLTFLGLLSLGKWQLNRAEEKKDIIASFNKNSTTTLSSLKKLETYSSQEIQYLNVILTGSALNQHSFLLDNQFYNHKVGFHVITPFLDNSTNSIVLVDRGFKSRGKSRLEKVFIAPLNEHQITVSINTIAGQAFTLNARQESTANKIPIFQKIDFKYWQKRLLKPLNYFVGQLKSTQSSYIQAWQPTTVMQPERHLGYAFQWFALAMAVLIIFFVTNYKQQDQ